MYDFASTARFTPDSLRNPLFAWLACRFLVIIVVGNLPSQWEKELFVETDGPKMSAVANTPIELLLKRIEILKKWQQCYQNFQKGTFTATGTEAELQKQQIQETMTLPTRMQLKNSVLK